MDSASTPRSDRDRTIRSWIYVPADSDEKLADAIDSGVDAVILDLEDLVPSAHKGLARQATRERLRGAGEVAWPRLYVRVNDPTSGLLERDLAACVLEPLAGIRLPKASGDGTVREVCRLISDLEVSRGVPPGSVRIVCNIESAVGVTKAADILSANARVDRLGFGEADFARDVGARIGTDKDETFVARSLLVLASRVAGKFQPCDGAHLRIGDQEELERTTRRGRDLGFFGRTAVHPSQVAVINSVYTPTASDIEWAHDVVEAQAVADRSGVGSAFLGDGQFIDVAVTRAAFDMLALADELAARTGARRVPAVGS